MRIRQEKHQIERETTETTIRLLPSKNVEQWRTYLDLKGKGWSENQIAAALGVGRPFIRYLARRERHFRKIQKQLNDLFILTSDKPVNRPAPIRRIPYRVETPEFADRGIDWIGCDTVEELNTLMDWLNQLEAFVG